MEQESQKREIEDTVGQTPNGPILCANNCGFFGSASTNNYCSKCYKDFFLKQSKVVSSVALVDKEKKAENDDDDEPMVDTVAHAVQEDDIILSSAAAAAAAAAAAVPREEGGTSSEDPGKKPSNRCNFCKKRVGLTGFKCRCGDTFCNIHRYSDKHNCSFDYKAAAQNAIAKANPIVKADKIEKI